MVEFGCVSSRIMCVKFEFARIKLGAVLVYIFIEKDDEGRERLCVG